MHRTTLNRFLIEERRRHPDATGDLNALINDVAIACKAIAKRVAYGGIDNILGASSTTNIQGETQQKLDVLANEMFLRANEWDGHLAGMVSEEMEAPFLIPARFPKGRYLLAFDPLATVGLLDARERANEMRREVSQGGNPVARKRQNREGADSKTFGALAQRYLIEHAERRKRSHGRDASNLELHVLPHWRNRPYSSIRRADVIELIERLISAGKPTLANRVQSLISGVYTFGLDADLVEANPCHRLKKRGVENVGRRILNNDEIRLFWFGIVETERSRRTGLGLRLALALGARVGEIAGIRRSELAHIDDPARAAWIIPGARCKNGRDHLLPLSLLARETVLTLLSLIGADEEFLLPTRSLHRAGPIRSNSLTQAMDFFSKRVEAASWNADPPTPHDLRRTIGTRLAELQIPKEIRDRVLNHVSSDVGSKHYNLHDYADEKRAALARWSAELSSILFGASEKVTPLRRRSVAL